MLWDLSETVSPGGATSDVKLVQDDAETISSRRSPAGRPGPGMSDRTPGAAPPGQVDAAAAGGGQRPRGRGLLRAAMMSGVVTALLAAVVVSSAYLIVRHDRSSAPGQLLRPSGIPASISTSLATLMALTPVPAAQAPGFTLTDQQGRTLSLAAFHGKVVVLEFMDPHCTDICPIVSNEFIDAYHDLGPLAGKVVFAAVNVNQYHAAVRDMAQYSSEHQLATIPDWHFLTGPVPQLQTVWRDYNVEVQAPNPNADIVHTSAVYFIDPQGREKYLASPMTDHTKAGTAYLPADQIASWGHGIALLARQLAR
jgi:cytochrome oxidase Cu insertion factor (SCO1/SenC/PrrC family)